VDDADGEVGRRRQGLAEMWRLAAASTIVSVQVPPTSVATMYLRVISPIGFRYRSMLRGSDDEN
jgi:hypothetical protein